MAQKDVDLSAGQNSTDMSPTPIPEGFVHDERAFIPFSHGPLDCVGRPFAMQEMRTMVVALVQRLRFRVPGRGNTADGVGSIRDEGEEVKFDLRAYENEYKDFFVAAKPHLPVVVEVR